MIVKALILATFCVAASYQQGFSAISTCSGLTEPANLYILNCGTGVCNFYKGSYILARWDVQAKNYTTLLRPSAHLIVSFGGKFRFYDIAEDQLSSSLITGQNLPLQAGSVATVNFQMPVPYGAVFNIPFQITITISDQLGHVVSCFTAYSIVKNY
ncbi:hypothetical protein G9C98_008334 [Cotesia typhae]|uniref:Uncharacterized protein n=1 Tax=Cotesia typhae TaxID=2053667 RepID=A0A8J5QJ01_9HYME|nr:hypothetical protein G9C98_008334 [Cotesia typhae]